MNRVEIRQLLKKKEAGKIDQYLKLSTKKKQNHCDLLNLLQTWAHSVLYYKRIYPHSAFQQRQILGISVIAASSPPLKQYLDQFFNKISKHLPHINHITILILDESKRLIEENTIHVQDLVNNFYQQQCRTDYENLDNVLLKEMQIKSFLYDLKSYFASLHQMQVQRVLTFKFRIGYRQQGQDKQSRNLLDGWILREKSSGKGKMACSLKSAHLNLIYEVIE